MTLKDKGPPSHKKAKPRTRSRSVSRSRAVTLPAPAATASAPAASASPISTPVAPGGHSNLSYFFWVFVSFILFVSVAFCGYSLHQTSMRLSNIEAQLQQISSVSAHQTCPHMSKDMAAIQALYDSKHHYDHQNRKRNEKLLKELEEIMNELNQVNQQHGTSEL